VGEWDALLAGLCCADAYLMHAYIEASCVLDPGEPVLLHVSEESGDVVFACIVRAIPGTDARDVTTPYGYGGPVGVGDDPPFARFYEQYADWCIGRGIASTFVRFHPLFENHRVAGPAMHAAYAAPTVGWTLDSDLLEGLHGKHRNTVRKAMKAGVTVEPTLAPSDLSAFAALYEHTMRRQEAAAYYFFRPAYWERLPALGARLVRFDASLDGEVVASALCLRGDRWLHYHLGATDEGARDLGASNLLLYEAALWGQERGLSEFHLGGGAGGREDGLLAFKKRFSPDGVREFWTGKAVHDEETYRRLSGGAEIDFEGFFPAYRVPGALSHTAGTPRSR
jgi:hypothetical protein